MKKIIKTIILTAAVTLTLSAQHQVQFPEVEAEVGSVSIPINTSGLGEIGSFTLNVGFDEAALDFSGFGYNPFEGDPNFLYSDKPGELRILWYSITPVEINDSLLTLNFEYSGGSSEISFISENEITDPVASPLSVEYIDGSISERVTGIKDDGIPRQYTMNQNYPNPFNPATSIRFGIPTQSKVKLVVFDILGRQVDTLVNGELSAGYHSVNFDASALSSGIYFYRMQARGINGNNFTDVRKMVLIK